MNVQLTKKIDMKELIKSISVIAIPVALQNLLSNMGGLIDTMMISDLGKQYIGAVGLCAQFSFLMFSCYWGFVGGGMLFISQYWGVKDDKGIERSYGIMTTCLMLVALIFTVLASVFPRFVLNVYTDVPSIQKIGYDYLRIVGFSYPFQVLSIGMSSLLRSTERVKIPLYASLASVATNTFLNWILIFGNLGAPKLGVQGAAIATVISSIVNVLVIFIASAFIKYPYLFRLKAFFNWNKEFLSLFFKKCAPIICNELLIGFGNLYINRVLGHQIEDAVAAVAVFRTIEGMVIGFFAGFSNASSVLVGKCVGAGETEKAYQRAIRIVYLCQLTILVVILVLLAVHVPLLHVMHLEGLSFEYGRGLIIIYGIFGIIRMGNWTQNDTYRSAGDATFGTVLEIIFMYLLVIPCIYLANYKFNAPFLVVFTCCYVDEPIRYVLMQIHMYSGKWIKPVTPEGKQGLLDFKQNHMKKGKIK